MEECFFCLLKNKDMLWNGDRAFIFLDNFPVTKFHSLIVPKRHIPHFFELTNEELLEIYYLLNMRKEQIIQADKTVEGFNVRVNIGLIAGQTIPHVHVHLIPRRHGDVANPTGGVRGIIPEKKDYCI